MNAITLAAGGPDSQSNKNGARLFQRAPRYFQYLFGDY
jgi:hypothetical protein